MLEDLDKFHICGFQAIYVHFSEEFLKAYTSHVNWQVLLQSQCQFWNENMKRHTAQYITIIYIYFLLVILFDTKKIDTVVHASQLIHTGKANQMKILELFHHHNNEIQLICQSILLLYAQKKYLNNFSIAKNTGSDNHDKFDIPKQQSHVF